MKFNLKNVFLSVGMLAFSFVLVGVFSTNKVEAANTCLVTGTGAKAWFNASNWSGCGGSFPTSADTVEIPTNVALTLDSGNATVAAVTFDDPAATSSSLDLNGYTLTVSGAVTLPASTGVGTATFIVGTGTLTAGSVSITGGASGISSMTVSTGNITTTGDFSLLGATAITKALLTSTSTSVISIGGNFVNTLGTVTNAGTMTITGNLTGGGTVVNSTNASLYLNGTTNTVTTLTATAAGNSVFYGGGAQTVIDTTAHTYYNLYLQGSGAKTLTGITTIQGLVLGGTATATTAANIAVAANIIVGSGTTLHLDQYSFSVGTTSTISGTVDTTTAVTGTKTFTGLVTVNSGGSFSLAAFNPVNVFGAGITNNSATAMNLGSGGTTLTGNIAGTGAVTFGGALEIAAGTTTNSNSSTVTVTGTLTLTGNWAQGASATLAMAGATPFAGAGTFSASTAGNTVNYTGGAQTIKDPNGGTAHTYSNLGLSGSGIKDATAANLLVGQTLTITAGTLSLATANTNTANKLYFGTTQQANGSWGSTGSSPAATHQNDTHFTAAADGKVTVALNPPTSSTGPTITTTPTVICTLPQVLNTSTNTCVTPTVTVVTCTLPQVINTATNACVTPATTTETLCPNGKTAVSNCTLAPGLAVAQAAGGNAYAFGTKLVKLGSKGEACEAWQTFFNDKAGAHLVVDGKCGKLTISAAKAWQKSMNLVADGLLGAKSRAKALAQ